MYRPRDLAISYLVGFGVALACFGVGAWACLSNGCSAWTSFSTVMRTTRNPQLDELVLGEKEDYGDDGAGGAEGRGENSAVRTVKLRYGIVNREGGEMSSHAAFGVDGTVTKIAKL